MSQTLETGGTGGTGGTEPQTSAEELLAAGAVLPAGEAAGERAVPLTARGYRHPALAERVVVRLVPEELGEAEDLAAGYLGLERDGEAAEVGVGLRRPLGFPEWVLVHHPEDGRDALDLVPELERLAQQAGSKPKLALKACQELAGRLDSAKPHMLPVFCEQAGRIFLSVDQPGYAAQLFARARQAEAAHGLPVDEERLDSVFLEFAVAGAIPVKALAGYARELSARVEAGEALRRFIRLCVRRTAHGMTPSPTMSVELRRLAKAAGEDPQQAERAFTADLFALPATLRAAAGWWKKHRKALAQLGREDATVRRRLLDVTPEGDDPELPGVWLDILQESGAAAALHDPARPEAERPADDSAGWLKRFLDFRGYGYRVGPAPALHALLERMAERLLSETAAAGRPLDVPDDIDVLDLLLSLGVPVADPGDGRLALGTWARGGERRDLLALAADPRFRPAFRRSANHHASDGTALRTLAASPGGRPMLAEWVAEVADRPTAVGLPELPEALGTLTGLPGEVLALAEREVRGVLGADLAPLLARTLRAGIFDELGWPVWDEAVADLAAREHVESLYVADAWPYLIVAGKTQARVLDADSAVLTHDLRIPAEDLPRSAPGCHYADGSLLVYWNSQAHDGELRGYWHTDAGRLLRLEGPDRRRGASMTWYRCTSESSTLPLPGGGRTTGAGTLRCGDTAVPEEMPLISDGESYWVWQGQGASHGMGWYTWDPLNEETGDRGAPQFLDMAADRPHRSHWLLPAGERPEGLVGWRSVKLTDGSWYGEDASGRSVTVPAAAGRPGAALVFPGDDRPRAVLIDSYRVRLVGPDGRISAVADTDEAPGDFAAGTALLPPPRHWHRLRPRDPHGSAALRAIGRETAAELLKAGAAAAAKDGEGSGSDDALLASVGALLPQIGHPALAAGVAGVVRCAARQQRVLEKTSARLEAALNKRPEKLAGPSDQEVCNALDGLGICGCYGPSAHRGDHGVAGFLHTVLAPGHAEAAPQGATHRDGPPLPYSRLPLPKLLQWTEAVACRALTAVTPDEQRRPLGELLELAAAAGIGAAGGSPQWRRLTLGLGEGAGGERITAPQDGARRLPLGDGAVLAVLGESVGFGDVQCTVLCHDPSGRFPIPAAYEVRGSEPLGPGWREHGLEAFLKLLAERGPAPWFPAAADEFARLTGVTRTTARLVVAGLPGVDVPGRDFLPREVRTVLDVSVGEAAFAREELRGLTGGVRRGLVAALLPEQPERLWTHGPDAAAAAAVWNAEVGRRAAVPEGLLMEATRAVRSDWEPRTALPALLDPAAEPRLSRDLTWTVRRDRAVPEEDRAVGFTAGTLTGAVELTAWLAHRLPAGDPVRAALPAALVAVRDRLAHPGLLLDLGRYVDLDGFRAAAGAPTEVTDTHERYGAVLMGTQDSLPCPAIRPSLLSGAGDDPYLRALRSEPERCFPVEAALELARSERFAQLLADPGDPADGERGKDGCWWPQDPSRSVPELVAEAAAECGLGRDAAALYLMLLAMPDPTDRNTARWTGWKPGRLKAARAELSGSGRAVEATRARAGRSLFLPGGWLEPGSAHLPLEQWKVPLYEHVTDAGPVLSVLVPTRPAAGLYRAAWGRVAGGDVPRLGELAPVRARRRR
ncbi:DNA-binding protein [Streptomyces sp. HNM0663]|uniref:DNA-binding protein n=1 Tax=Streptomyces chengmaiensis TaxID=3040919 RepID=A0ABT6HND0_9ACTN|nr:DNA-binding protein [Streptomyces chengmaiensis]MDH2390186.1 DNA-binding protein [Streptomyces chengmaiensis]